MKIAVSEYRNKVATTCDFANNVIVFTCDNGKGINMERLELKDHFIPLRCAKLKDNGIDILICGAISASFVIMLQHRGIEVISGVTGEIKAVVQDFLKGNINLPQYRLPGFEGNGCQRNRHRIRCKSNKR